MRKIFAFLVSMLVIASCTDPFDATSIWDKLNEHENKINDIENGVNGSGEIASNKIYYTTADGKKLFPNNTEPAAFGAILVSNIYENGLGVLTFDDDITSIGSSAFSNCYGLTSVTIPNNVTSIGKYAFDGCSGLTSVTMPDSVTSIGESAFRSCSGLTSVTIPNSVTSIGEYAFCGCSSLKEVHINDLTAWCNVDFKSDDSNPLYYARNLYLNRELVTNLVIPNSVTEIKSHAFILCSGLTSVTIPDSITSIREDAFNGCSNLASIIVASGNPVYDSRENCNAIIETATNILIQGCNNTIIPSNITGIGRYAFEGCNTLTSITIPNSVTSIGYNAFYGCSGLEKVELNCTIINDWFRDKSSIKEIIIGKSVTSIGESAFLGCSNLTSITIPNNVTRIENNAFDGCCSLKELNIEDGKDILSLGYKSSSYSGWSSSLFYDSPLETLYLGRNLSYKTDYSYGYSPFYAKSTLTSLTIGNSVTSIGSDAFKSCSGLTSITIPNSVTSIGEGAFSSCSGLTSITIPDSVTGIGEYAFAYCTGLTSVTIPNSVTSISGYTFDGCSNLTSITIPNSVASIGHSAFDYCSSLKEVHITDLDAWKNISFGSYGRSNPLDNSNAKLYLNGVEVTDY